ncbi:unnamed protein product [Pelagomonas calceolata]|uniref:Sulfotransferase domain-containing protein n=2 Tax=Pelagomonas calceolata TaxID=35677 RepID=A0A7S4E3N8_9STRA|nr:unnamed protein product [Pelagomonas calceolata]|mmetsp:Transcript_11933/g.36786  ORF Transcript_11933/g.36786 Transcript_11933/m.36786 type:complete len:413 (+) Transcript_11933:131-1369(+)
MMLRRASGTKAPPPPERLPSQDKYKTRVLPLLAAAVGCIVAASLLLRTTATAWAVQTDDVVTCPEQRRMSGRAVPGTTLADDGHCVQASSLDAGVCVEDAADWRGAHRRRCLPSLAVIGAMKSGTTNIMLYLQNHPQLRTSEDMIGWPQESRYFSAAHDPEAAGRNWRFYLRKYPPATDGVLTFDKSPNYLLNPKIPSVLASLMPSLKLLVCLRNPTSRAYSHLQHECRNGRVRQAEGAVFRSKSNDESSERLSFPCAPEAFDRLVRAQLAAKKDLDKCAWARGSGSGDSNVLPRGFYDCQLAPWFDRFPRSQLLALVFEDFVSSREATLEAVARVERFAGLEPFDYGRSARVAAVERLYALMPSRGGRYAPMLAATRAALDELYCAPNRALSATLRRRLPWPCGGGGERPV